MQPISGSTGHIFQQYIYIYICFAKYFKQVVASLQQELFQKLAF